MFHSAFSANSRWYDNLRLCTFCFSITLAIVRLFVVFAVIICYRSHNKSSLTWKLRCLSFMRCTAGSEFSFLWAITGILPLYLHSYMQWFIVESNFMHTIFDLVFEAYPALAIKCGEYMAGEVTTGGFVSLTFTWLVVLKSTIVFLAALVASLKSKSCLAISPAEADSAIESETIAMDEVLEDLVEMVGEMVEVMIEGLDLGSVCCLSCSES